VRDGDAEEGLVKHYFDDDAIFKREHWFKFSELYRDQVRRAKNGAVFVELGCYEGRSAAFMAVEIANSKKKIEFHCVDLWKKVPFAEFKRNLAPVAHLIAGCYREDSAKAARHFEDGSLDFVFVDAGHFEADVMRDIHAWWPKLKPGGVLAGDDFWWYPSTDPVQYTVWAGVQRCFGNYELMVRNHWAIWHVTKTAENETLLEM
jgi:predicted O-methyltransferase YrrM